MKKKIGFTLLLAGLTWGLATLGAFSSWPHAAGAVALVLAGIIVLAIGMRREGPRDEELPTAEARHHP